MIFRVKTTEIKPMRHAKKSESMASSVSSIQGLLSRYEDNVSDMVSDTVCGTSAPLAH